MQETIYFILFAAAFFLMMRFGCGAHVMGHGHSHGGKTNGHGENKVASLHWIPPVTDVDPVCGKTVGTNGAKSSIHDGQVYYFCSQDCRERFEAAPDRYLNKPTSP